MPSAHTTKLLCPYRTRAAVVQAAAAAPKRMRPDQALLMQLAAGLTFEDSSGAAINEDTATAALSAQGEGTVVAPSQQQRRKFRRVHTLTPGALKVRSHMHKHMH